MELEMAETDLRATAQEEKPLARQLFEHRHVEFQLDDALMAAFGADPNDPTTWPCGDFGYDDYDDSFELYGTKLGWTPTQEQVDAAIALGFARGWIDYTDGTERYCTHGQMGDAVFKGAHGGEHNSARQERNHRRHMEVLSAALAAVQQETKEQVLHAVQSFVETMHDQHFYAGGTKDDSLRATTCRLVLDKLAEIRSGALSAPKAPRPEAASQSLRGDTPFGRLRGAMAEELADVDINARMEEVRGGWASEVFDPPLWWRRGGEEWEPVYNAAVLMSYVLNAQRHGREFTVLRTQSPPSSVRPDAGLHDGHLAAQANEPTWQPIETAPKDGTYLILCEPKFRSRAVIGKWFDFEQTIHGETGFWEAHAMQVYPTGWMPIPPPGGLVDHLQGKK